MEFSRACGARRDSCLASDSLDRRSRHRLDTHTGFAYDPADAQLTLCHVSLANAPVAGPANRPSDRWHSALMSTLRILSLTSLAMLAFAANSLLCRAALDHTPIDAASFTSLRLISGAVILYLLIFIRQHRAPRSGHWWSALALFAYATGFSFAYLQLSAATGALILFGAVQLTMMSYGIYSGERFNRYQWLGFVLAAGGLLGLLLPGASAPSAGGALLMIGAGCAWGVYSLRGRSAVDPLKETCGNFLRSVPIALLFSLLFIDQLQLDSAGILYAILSGALASGLGYAIWYSVLPQLPSTRAATVQLSVPVLTAFGGVLMLGEAVDTRLVLTSAAILGGIALVIRSRA